MLPLPDMLSPFRALWLLPVGRPLAGGARWTLLPTAGPLLVGALSLVPALGPPANVALSPPLPATATLFDGAPVLHPSLGPPAGGALWPLLSAVSSPPVGAPRLLLPSRRCHRRSVSASPFRPPRRVACRLIAANTRSRPHSRFATLTLAPIKNLHLLEVLLLFVQPWYVSFHQSREVAVLRRTPSQAVLVPCPNRQPLLSLLPGLLPLRSGAVPVP